MSGRRITDLGPFLAECSHDVLLVVSVAIIEGDLRRGKLCEDIGSAPEQDPEGIHQQVVPACRSVLDGAHVGAVIVGPEVLLCGVRDLPGLGYCSADYAKLFHNIYELFHIVLRDQLGAHCDLFRGPCSCVIRRWSCRVAHDPRGSAAHAELHSVSRLCVDCQLDRRLIHSARDVHPCDTALDAPHCRRCVIGLSLRSACRLDGLSKIFEDVHCRHICPP